MDNGGSHPKYHRRMTNQKATSAVIPPLALRRLLLKVEDRMQSTPRLKLIYHRRTRDIWRYYGVIKVVPVGIDKLRVIPLTIPILDKSLELNIDRVVIHSFQMVRLKESCNRGFHKLSTMQECQYCQLCFSCAIRSELD